MKHLLKSAVVILWVAIYFPAQAQQSVALYCWNPSGSQATNNQYVPCNSINPLVVSISPGTPSFTVTANQGGAPWSENITQFGGSNVQTGIGIGGTGVPRVTVSSDSFPATQAISLADTATAGTITATDVLAPAPTGNGVLIGTAPSANSFVALQVQGGSSAVTIQITGTATGTYYFEDSSDSTTGSDGNWAALVYRQVGLVADTPTFSTTTIGEFRGNNAGLKWVRVRNVGGTTPNNPIVIRTSNGGGGVFLNSPLPGQASGQNATAPSLWLQSGCQFNTSPSTISSGNGSALQCDNVGDLKVTTVPGGGLPLGPSADTGARPVIPTSTSNALGGITPVASSSAGSSLVLKASAGNFYSGSAVNATSTAGFCLIINATSAPTTGSAVAPLAFAVLPASGQCSIGNDAGIPSVFSTGITFLVSSNASPFTFTSGAITAAISGKVK